ncbi:guanosine polyphosphate pyrophosphohydrolase [Leptolinea tardivitalis]|nr:HD domain-containing protein [Leptolinea tardivitalis]GAP20627.1 guanosine polyphosphate pyrophosphohydrolase [Leptolinea tardivitalis]
MILSERFKDALWRATDLHANQSRKGSGVPFVAHLLGVASLVLEYGGTEDEAIAALLHDAVEDQGGQRTREMIADKYGATIAQIVDGCTDSDTIPKPPWRERKEAYIAHIATASPSVLLVSACDKLYNARSILADYRVMGEEIWERFKGGKKDGTLWYYQALVEAYKKTGQHRVYDELERTVREIVDMVQSNDHD